MAPGQRDINDTRCHGCSLIRPCPCDAEKNIHGTEPQERGLGEPIIILNKRRRSSVRRHSNPQGKIKSCVCLTFSVFQLGTELITEQI